MALTLPSSNGASYLTTRPGTLSRNSHFNGGLTQTTATVTPTRLKNIEESFLDQSILPPKPERHQHMAGFVTPSVNISLFVKPPATFNHVENLKNSTQDYYNSSTNSNSNDSFPYSEEYSSEESSSAFESSNHSFSNVIEMNRPSSSRSKKSSTTTAAASSKSRKSASNAGSSQAKPKKSTGGGRKPTRNDKLTPEEEQKRAKRRERNKLAAARCRKRRLDQTNILVDQTTDLEVEHEKLSEQLQGLLEQMNAMKRYIELHERVNCKNKSLRFQNELSQMCARIDYDEMQEAMKPMLEDDDLLDISAPSTPNPSKPEPQPEVPNYASNATSVIVSHSNSGDTSTGMVNFANLGQPTIITVDPSEAYSGLKRKRPNTLLVSNSYQASCETSNSNALTTPSSGMLFGDAFETGSGLTPLMPTLTPSALTPSTMAAFVKSLASPMDDPDKKLIII